MSNRWSYLSLQAPRVVSSEWNCSGSPPTLYCGLSRSSAGSRRAAGANCRGAGSVTLWASGDNRPGNVRSLEGKAMTSRRVLVIGLDPVSIPGWDPEPVVAAISRGQARFADHGIEADLCLVAPDDDPEATIVEALTRQEYACVVVGGGIRK